jgi:tetratricopeptide (TPR) repeat protein
VADFVQRGRQLFEEGQFQEAVKVCRLGLLASPNELEGRLILGSALLALKRYDEVLGEVRTVLGHEPSSAWALALKGEALLRKGDAAQACDVLTRAMAGAAGDQRIRDLYVEARRLRDQEAPRPPATALAAKMGSFDARSAFSGLPGEASTADGRGPLLGKRGGEASRVPDTTTGTGSIDLDPMTEVADVERTVRPDPIGARPQLSSIDDEFDRGDDDGDGAPTDDDSSAGIELDTGDLLVTSGERSLRAASYAIDDPPPSRYPEPAGYLDDDEPAAPRGAAAGEAIDDRGDAVWAAAVAGPAGTRPSTAGLDALFPEEEDGGGVSKLAPLEPPSAHGRDMKVIRSGLGLPEEASLAGSKLPPEILERERAEARRIAEKRGRAASTIHPRTSPPARPWYRRSARGVPLLVYALLALVVVAGAVLAGLKVRGVRLTRQIAAARAGALAMAAADSFPGYVGARDRFARIVRARDDVASRAAYARMTARLYAEFGEGEAQATKALAAVTSPVADVLAARAYLALAGDPAAAVAAAAALAKAAPADPDVDYLTGRAALAADRPADAAEAFRRALARGARPLVHVYLARAELAQGRDAEALAVLERARAALPGQPSVAIWSALVRAQVGSLGPPGDPEASLEAMIADGGRPPEGQTIGVSRRELAWAELARAEVALARGDLTRATAGLDRAAALAPTDPDFGAGLAEARLRAGDVAGARAEVERLVARDPKRRESRIVAARVAIGAGDPGGALAALEQAGDLTSRPDALALRGRAQLAAGAFDRAAADLDAALAARPDLPAAAIARAGVDVARGDAAAALARIDAVYQAHPGSIEIALTYASIARMAGDTARARAVLDKLGGEPTLAVLLERGRLARAEGAFDAAKQAFAAAKALNPAGVEARLELAALALALGDAAGHRTMLDELVADAPTSGPALVEAAMAHTLLGDLDGAAGLLERAAAAAATPSWKLYRERGRVHLRKGEASKAIAELDRAKAVRLDDAEAHLLAAEAALLAEDAKLAARAVAEAETHFKGTPVAATAKGIAGLVGERPADAIAGLQATYAKLVEAKAAPRDLGRVAYWLGRAYFADGNTAKAVEWLGQATTRDPGHADAFFYLGVVLESEQPAKAMAAYEKAVALDPAGNPQAWLSMADYYGQNRQPAAARRACDEYLRRWPTGEFAESLKALRAKLR